jgi:hypothetical protein
MRSSSRGLLCAVCGVFALAVPVPNFAQAQSAQETAGKQQVSQASSSGVAPGVTYTAVAVSEFPDSPGAVRAQEQGSANQQSSPAAGQTKSAASPQTNTPANPPSEGQADQKVHRPVGTAAAEAPKVSGITAAEPAGIAMAPAKQHRVRTIAIKVGAILGAGAAIGTVIALTEATPSKPPGAH